MKSFALLSALAVVGSVDASTVNSKRATVTPITVRGNAFYKGDERFYIRGMDYQPGGDAAALDPLADPEICMRDIRYFKDLGINTIRVYTVDNSKDHTECMNALAAEGIYLVLDVNTGGEDGYSINRANPSVSYNAAYLEYIFATVVEFAKYPNTFAFFSGNEVINERGNEFNAPYMKAVTRDIRAFIRAQKLRSIPVGYSAADVSENRLETALYMNCGPKSVRSDFFAFNDYSWCNSDYKTSGWDQKVKNFTDYGIPLFLSEYGCNQNGARKFEEIGAMMSKDMTPVYSGGLMYEYSYEESKYGIVQLSGDKGSGSVSKVGNGAEYDNFKKALKAYPPPSGDGGASKTSKASKCPDKSSGWNVDPSLVPEMPQEAQKFLKDGVSKGAGLKGPGSQKAGDSGMSTKNVTASASSDGGNDQQEEGSASTIKTVPMLATCASLALAILGTMLW